MLRWIKRKLQHVILAIERFEALARQPEPRQLCVHALRGGLTYCLRSPVDFGPHERWARAGDSGVTCLDCAQRIQSEAERVL